MPGRWRRIPGSELFSAASIWEVVIKAGLGRPDFNLDGGVLRRKLLEHRYNELPVFSSHVLALQGLPPLHKGPFDRLLLAQARAEGLYVLTADHLLRHYPGAIIYIPARDGTA